MRRIVPARAYQALRQRIIDGLAADLAVTALKVVEAISSLVAADALRAHLVRQMFSGPEVRHRSLACWTNCHGLALSIRRRWTARKQISHGFSRGHDALP